MVFWIDHLTKISSFITSGIIRVQILRMEYGVGALSFSSLAGKGVTDKQLAQDNLQNPYKVSSTTNRGQAFAKIGYLFPDEQYKSMAVQFSGVYHDHQSLFGNSQYLGKADKWICELHLPRRTG